MQNSTLKRALVRSKHSKCTKLKGYISLVTSVLVSKLKYEMEFPNTIKKYGFSCYYYFSV